MRGPAAAQPPVEYLKNIRKQNDLMRQQQNERWDTQRRSGQRGVQVDKAR